MRLSGSASRPRVPSRKSQRCSRRVEQSATTRRSKKSSFLNTVTALLLAPSKWISPNPVIVVSQRSLGPDGLRGDGQAGRRFHLLGWRLAREMG